MSLQERHRIALECFGGFDEFQKLARVKLSSLLKDEVVQNGVETLDTLSQVTDIPLRILELLCDDPERVPISADLVECLACPLNVSMAQFLAKPNISEENRRYLRTQMDVEGFSIGLHPGEKNPFDVDNLFAYLTALDAINAIVAGKENAFLNEHIGTVKQ